MRTLPRGTSSGLALGRRAALGVCLGTACLLTSGYRLAAAQGLVNVGRMEVGLRWQSGVLGQQGSPSTSTRDRRLWLTLPMAGTLPIPRLLSYGFNFNPTWFDGTSSDRDGSDRGKVQGYSFWGELLSGRAVSLSASGGRTPSTFLGSRGEVSEATSTDSRISGAIRTRYLSLQADMGRRQYDGSLRVDGQDTPPLLTQFDIHTSRVTLVNSKLQMSLGRTSNEVDNPREAYQGWDGSVDHNFRWGKGSHLGTRYYHLVRSGDADTRQTEWSETLHLQHTGEIQSDHTWRRTTTKIDLSDLRVASLSSRLSGRIGPSLTGGVSLNQSSSSNQDTRFSNLILSPQIGISQQLPGRMEFRAQGTLGFESSRSAGALETSVGVIDERHTVEPGLRFTLLRANALAPSVVVRSATGELRFVLGTDYLVRENGAFLTIEVLPGGRIKEGEGLLVTYEYRSVGVPSERAVRVEYGLALERGGLELTHARSVRDVVGGTGDPILLKANEFDESRTGLTFRTGTRFGELSLYGVTTSRARYTLGRRSITKEGYVGGDLLLPPVGRIDLTVGFYYGGVRVDSTRSRTVRGSLSAVWNPSPTLRVNGRVEALELDQSFVSADSRYLTSTSEIQWRPGRLEVDLRYDHIRYDIFQVSTVHRVTIQLVRRF